MRYELMLPHQIRKAIAENWPVVLPLGVLEYHGEHMAVGMDTLAVIKMLELLEQEIDLVILPPFYYGAASYAVEPPEGNGSVQVEGGMLAPFAEALFFSLLQDRFPQHPRDHPSPDREFHRGHADRPRIQDRLAGRRSSASSRGERGEGWWGNEKTANYYAEHAAGNNPFNWVQVHALMSPEIMAEYPFDHAGEGETSLMMALCPEAVDMAHFAENTGWYTASAKDASAELGSKGRDMILERLRMLLKRLS